jgi:hypothetical protein
VRSVTMDTIIAQDGVHAITDYRVYSVGRDGHFVSVKEISCADDADAMLMAWCLLDPRPVEVWEHARFVGTLARFVVSYPSPCGAEFR